MYLMISIVGRRYCRSSVFFRNRRIKSDMNGVMEFGGEGTIIRRHEEAMRDGVCAAVNVSESCWTVRDGAVL